MGRRRAAVAGFLAALPTAAVAAAHLGAKLEPGEYVLTSEAYVGETIELDSKDITTLKVGTKLRVVEVVSRTDMQRVRGRIDQPLEGWVSLEDLSDSSRWVRSAELKGVCEPGACLAPGIIVSTPDGIGKVRQEKSDGKWAVKLQGDDGSFDGNSKRYYATLLTALAEDTDEASSMETMLEEGGPAIGTGAEPNKAEQAQATAKKKKKRRRRKKGKRKGGGEGAQNPQQSGGPDAGATRWRKSAFGGAGWCAVPSGGTWDDGNRVAKIAPCVSECTEKGQLGWADGWCRTGPGDRSPWGWCVRCEPADDEEDEDED